ncbi:hypothetical protein [Paenibacillus amylolyticus]
MEVPRLPYEYDTRNRLVKAGKLKYRYNSQGDRIELAQRGQGPAM